MAGKMVTCTICGQRASEKTAKGHATMRNHRTFKRSDGSILTIRNPYEVPGTPQYKSSRAGMGFRS